MTFTSVLVANRGEIACRILRAVGELGIGSVAVYAADDVESTHRRRGDRAVALPGRGAAAYLDIDQMVSVALETGCDAIHPGYGFLSENADLARACEAAGLVFIGPGPDILDALGDKSAARDLATACGIPVLAGTGILTDAAMAESFLDGLGDPGSIILKAVGGGGGRGMRVIGHRSEIAEALERCRSEASAAFGRGDIYAEQLVPRARHVEVQIVGDHHGRVVHLGERECTLQRRHQKLVELAPAPGLDPRIRSALSAAAVTMAERLEYRSLGTFEFLVDADSDSWFFIEANPRLQVEHTVTEEVTGVDLVQTQILLASGRTLADVGLPETIAPRGQAIQVRINTETMVADGSAKPTGGTLTAFDPPSGLGIRTETHGRVGYTTAPAYDSLLAKVIVHHPAGHPEALRRMQRALADFGIDGVATNRDFLRALLERPEVAANAVTTRSVDSLAAEVITAADALADPTSDPDQTGSGLAGRRLASDDPLAVLALGRTERATASGQSPTPLADGLACVAAPLQGTIVALAVDVGERGAGRRAGLGDGSHEDGARRHGPGVGDRPTGVGGRR